MSAVMQAVRLVDWGGDDPRYRRNSRTLSEGVGGGHLGASGEVSWAQKPCDLTGDHGSGLSLSAPGCTSGSADGDGGRVEGFTSGIWGMLSWIRQNSRLSPFISPPVKQSHLVKIRLPLVLDYFTITFPLADMQNLSKFNISLAYGR